MLVANPCSPAPFFQDRFERHGHNTSNGLFVPDTATLLAQDQIPDLTLPEALFVHSATSTEFIPDFSDHYIPPLDPYPPPRLSSRCMLDAFTASTSSGRRFAISPADYTPCDALIHTLPASILTPPRVQEVRERPEYQHDEYHAFNANTRARRGSYADMTEIPYTSPQIYAYDSDPNDHETYRPEDDINPDPPPPYYSAEARRANRILREEEWMEQYRQRIIEEEWPRYPPRYRATRNYEGWDSTWKDIGSSLGSCFAGVGKTVKEMRRKQRERRAQGKMEWWERHEFVGVRNGNQFGVGRGWCVSGRG